tara:strand:+ start:50 stop:739 length:690 start_codon:yes stop_codon:yes gene_type:complete
MWSSFNDIWILSFINFFILMIILLNQLRRDSTSSKKRYAIDYENNIQHITYDPAYDDWVGWEGDGVHWHYSSEYWVEDEAIKFKRTTSFFFWGGIGLSAGWVWPVLESGFNFSENWLSTIIFCFGTIFFIYSLFRLWWGKIAYMRNNTYLINKIKIARGHKKATLYNYHARHGFQINEKNLTPKQSKDLEKFLFDTCWKREWWLEGYADDAGFVVKRRKYLEKLRKSRG